MKLLVLSSVVPFRTHGEKIVTAVNIITFEIIRCLRDFGHEISLQVVYHPSHALAEISAPERAELSHLEETGVRVLPPFLPNNYGAKTAPARFRTLRMALSREACLAFHYPSAALGGELERRCREAGTQAILSIWTPEGVAAARAIDLPHVAYHGDIEWVPPSARLSDRSLFGGSGGLSLLDRRLRVALLKKLHLSLMGTVDSIANIAACNSAYYADHGHPDSFYAGSTWTDHGDIEPMLSSLPDGPDRTLKIIGHAGHLARTGSTYGLHFLLADVLPHLDMALQGRRYELHVIGGGQAVPAVEKLLNHPRVVRRGFVEDLDADLRNSDIFCIFNNVGPYLATFTRQIIAWSMGLCCATHERSALPIPETNGKNVIIGSTGEEIARKMAHACTDAHFNFAVRRAGRKTYEEHFRPELVARKLDGKLRSLVEHR